MDGQSDGSLDLFIQYDPSVVDVPADVPVHPVASEVSVLGLQQVECWD
jgi:hypothetical protein